MPVLIWLYQRVPQGVMHDITALLLVARRQPEPTRASTVNQPCHYCGIRTTRTACLGALVIRDTVSWQGSAS